MANRPRKFYAIAPDNSRELVSNISSFCDKNGMMREAVTKCLNGQQHSHRGWSFKGLTDEELALDDRGVLESDETNQLSYMFGMAKTPQETRELVGRILMRMGDILLDTLEGKRDPPAWLKDPSKQITLLEKMCAAKGIKYDDVADERTVEERLLEKLDDLANQPESALSMFDDELAELDAQLDRAINLAIVSVEEKMVKKADAKKKHPVWTEQRLHTARKWQRRVKTIRRLRDHAKNPLPKGTENRPKPHRDAIEATHTIRFQLYVGRSDIGKLRSERVFKVGRIHIDMAMTLWIAENRIGVTERGFVRPGDTLPSGNVFRGVPYVGCLILLPPRHGKTAFIRHHQILTICKNNRSQGAYVHAVDDRACAHLAYVASAFDTETDTGKITQSLFPLTLAKYDNNAHTIRVKTDDPPAAPNLSARGMESAMLSINLDYINFDDAVPVSDVYEESKREKRKYLAKATWLSRFQGHNGFFVISGYPHHREDLLWSYVEQARRSAATKGREGTPLMLFMRPVGGPRTSPPFKPIWPEMYPAKVLRLRYMTYNDATIWNANYMLSPISDELRIVRKVRLYDRDSEQHKLFLAGASFHLSADPSFTNTATSDSAGVVVAGIGEVQDFEQREDGPTLVTSRRKIRVITFREIKATQKELSDVMAEIARSRRIDLCHCETAGGGGAVIEFLQAIHGIESVIGHKPGPRKKETRLRQVASMFEDSADDLEAVVEFPGIMNAQGELELDPRFKKLVDYIINFRVTSGYHGLDALMQLCSYLAPDVGIGLGDVTRQVQAQASHENNRIREFMQADRKLQAQERGRWTMSEDCMNESIVMSHI